MATTATAVLDRVSTPPAELDGGERLQVVDALLRVVEGAYCHLPQKRAAYAVDPVQGLRLLRRRCVELDDDTFHRAVTALLTGMRDGHTRYHGPASLQGRVAVLPFLVESFRAAGAHQYVVSKVATQLTVEHPAFGAGISLITWNGVPIARAVDIHAEQETGSHPDARRMFGLQSLTARSLRHGPPPDELWVDVGFRSADGAAHEVRVPWVVIAPDGGGAARADSPAGMRWAADPAGEDVRRAKKALFAPGADPTHESIPPAASPAARTRRAAAPRPIEISPQFQDVLRASRVDTPAGEMGHLRIFSFDIEDDDAFLAEVARVLTALPRRGLVVDLRGNPGGLIWAAERMLQLFTDTTKRRIAPTRFALLASPLTRAMAANPFNRFELDAWAPSLDEAVATGEPYSRPLPLTDPEWCNDRKRVYRGPVVAVVDALTYSAGDLFAAGWVDNEIGPLVAVGNATGGGGANVWTDGQLRDALSGSGEDLDALPDGVGFSLSIRRAIRSARADGTPIEDLGIAGIPYEMTARDLLADNADLLAFCAEQIVVP